MKQYTPEQIGVSAAVAMRHRINGRCMKCGTARPSRDTDTGFERQLCSQCEAMVKSREATSARARAKAAKAHGAA